MMTISKMYRIEGMHWLPGHEGQCANPHGHSYRIWFEVAGPLQFAEGRSDYMMVMDYGELSAIVEPIIKQLDHSNLNETAPKVLGITRTTAEALALGLFEAVVDKIGETWATGSRSLVAVRVSETEKTWAEWRP